MINEVAGVRLRVHDDMSHHRCTLVIADGIWDHSAIGGRFVGMNLALLGDGNEEALWDKDQNCGPIVGWG